MSTNPCRFGWDCHRRDCWFAHPTGRAIDAAPTTVAANPGTTSSSATAPSSYNGIAKPITSSNLNGYSADYPTDPGKLTSSSSRGPNPCRYGRECRREACWFLHPEGRDIDDKEGNEDYDEALDEFEGKAAPTTETTDDFSDEDEAEIAYRLSTGEAAETVNTSNNNRDSSFICPCCHGDPQHCSTPTCVTAGICACQADLIVDDSWRDEWFAASRSCDCCKGYIYRCDKQRDPCRGGTCFCSPNNSINNNNNNNNNTNINNSNSSNPPLMNGVHSPVAPAS